MRSLKNDLERNRLKRPDLIRFPDWNEKKLWHILIPPEYPSIIALVLLQFWVGVQLILLLIRKREKSSGGGGSYDWECNRGWGWWMRTWLLPLTQIWSGPSTPFNKWMDGRRIIRRHEIGRKREREEQMRGSMMERDEESSKTYTREDVGMGTWVNGLRFKPD